MNLIPFDLEAAKKDPTRVVYSDGYTAPSGTAFFAGPAIVFVNDKGDSVSFGPAEYRALRLTATEPKRVKVAGFKSAWSGRIAWTDEPNLLGSDWRQVTDWVEIEIREVMG